MSIIVHQTIDDLRVGWQGITKTAIAEIYIFLSSLKFQDKRVIGLFALPHSGFLTDKSIGVICLSRDWDFFSYHLCIIVNNKR